MSLINLNHRLGAKEILFKVVHEQVGIGGGHMGAHGRTFRVEEMLGDEGEIVALYCTVLKENICLPFKSSSVHRDAIKKKQF